MPRSTKVILQRLSDCSDHPWFDRTNDHDLAILDAKNCSLFPPHNEAQAQGLLALGGDLSVARLLAAYQQGIFPWYGEGEPIKWWSPDPRSVFLTGNIQINRSLRRALRGKHWHLTVDQDFAGVIRGCAEPRDANDGTWLVPDMIDAYCALHRAGYAHSVEVWEGERLVGGIYGVAIGRLFCGESMFCRESGASKLAFAALGMLLAELGFPLLDSQVLNHHTASLGALQIWRDNYLALIESLTAQEGYLGSWAPLSAKLIQPCRT